MSNVLAIVSRDILFRSGELSSYRVSLVPTSDMPDNGLSQSGPVCDGVVHYTGVFNSKHSAIADVLAYVDTPCRLHQNRDGTCTLERLP